MCMTTNLIFFLAPPMMLTANTPLQRKEHITHIPQVKTHSRIISEKVAPKLVEYGV